MRGGGRVRGQGRGGAEKERGRGGTSTLTVSPASVVETTRPRRDLSRLTASMKGEAAPCAWAGTGGRRNDGRRSSGDLRAPLTSILKNGSKKSINFALTIILCWGEGGFVRTLRDSRTSKRRWPRGVEVESPSPSPPVPVGIGTGRALSMLKRLAYCSKFGSEGSILLRVGVVAQGILLLLLHPPLPHHPPPPP